MAKPWLSIIGIGENALTDLNDTTLSLIKKSEFIFGGQRHLNLVNAKEKGIVWPVPFSINLLLEKRYHQVVVLASGNPFWFGVGGTISNYLDPSEWICYPSPSIFSFAASKLGWRLETVKCLGLHASPTNQLLDIANDGEKLLILCRDGDSALEIKRWFKKNNFGESQFWILESLGGPKEKISSLKVKESFDDDIRHPVTLAINVKGKNGLPKTPGLPDDLFVNDGQITKQFVRAITIAQLEPKPYQILWDLGAGSGSVSIEWCRTNKNVKAIAFEKNELRIQNIMQNMLKFGLNNQLKIVKTELPKIPENIEQPDAVFIGGGLSSSLLSKIWKLVKPGTKIVVTAVTLESERILLKWNNEKGGKLIKVAISQAEKLGTKSGWKYNMPLIQWSITK